MALSKNNGGLNLGNASIGQFVIPNLSLSSTDTESPSLTALANNHLSQDIPFKLDLGGFSQEQTNKNNEIDLQALANLHLDNTTSTESVFQIPSLFESGESTQQKIKPINEKKSDFIDLSSALNAVPLKPTVKAEIVEKPKEEEKVNKKPSEIELLIPIDFWEKENEKVNFSKASALGKVICRRWKYKHRPSVLTRKSSNICTIEHFKFDTPSPDTIVREAQKQAFGRTN